MAGLSETVVSVGASEALGTAASGATLARPGRRRGLARRLSRGPGRSDAGAGRTPGRPRLCLQVN